MTAETIIKLARKAGIPMSAVMVLDGTFACPTKASIKSIGRGLSELLASAGLKYKTEAFDCNRFAKLASAMADIGWINSHPTEDAIAFGIMALASRSHAFNVTVETNSGGAYRFCYYEPQPQNGICLAPLKIKKEELTSCVSLLFL